MKKTALDYILKVRVPIVLFVVLASFSITYYISRPERDGIGYAPEQPINFSHKLHAGQMRIDCQYCHVTADKSRFASVPSTATCMNCHTVARKDRPEIIKLKKYYDENKPIPWKRVHKVPEFAYFSHSSHVNRGIDCAKCHGDVASMDRLTQVSSFVMSACLDCHRNAHERLPELKNTINRGPEYCNACHR